MTPSRIIFKEGETIKQFSIHAGEGSFTDTIYVEFVGNSATNYTIPIHQLPLIIRERATSDEVPEVEFINIRNKTKRSVEVVAVLNSNGNIYWVNSLRVKDTP
mmetsp:Transcript_26534/g.4650  ORF Transcript_26534/g.4650 Transcript_26534/m.4650 type:complete len:103 (+) Transcript_26534:154-462(+)